MKSAQVTQFFLLTLSVNALSVFAKSTPNTIEKDPSFTDLPDGLLLGAGTSAAQIEGALTANGKSESYIHWLMHAYLKNVSVNITSDSYHKYKEDIKVLEYTKLHVYRFVISCPRLFDTGYANHIHEDGVRYDRTVLDGLRKVDFQLLVLLHHFVHPAVMEKSNTSENERLSEPTAGLEINSNAALDLPDGFLLGAGTSAFQTEGAASTNGKSKSYIEWLLQKLYKNVSAEVASDSYHMYKEDVKVLEYTKLNVYRFSMSWVRLLPTGYADFVNEDGVKYYHALLDDLEKIGVKPIVLLHHFDHPAVLEDLNIWETGQVVELFSDYAKFIFKEFGNRVENFVTFNEPNLFCYMMISLFWSENHEDESQRMARAYACGHNVLKAHAQVYHMYHDEFNTNGNGKLSINIECENYFSKNSRDELSAEVAFQFQCGWLAHPIYSKYGDYHNIVKQWVQENSFAENLTESRLPEFSAEWIERIKGSADYFGLNHYSSHLVEPAPLNNPQSYVDSHFMSDARLLVSESPCNVTAMGLCVAPEGFRNLLRKINKEYDNPTIYVIENGYSDDGRLNDTNRIKYLYSYIKEIINAIKYDNIDIKAYIYWSLIDSFEFNNAFNIRFGLAHVDVDSEKRTRTLRRSANWLRNVMHTRKLQIDGII